jgi:hypothetical protein
MFKVIDTCIKPGGPDRTHEIMIEGRLVPITFAYGKALELPEPTARKFVPIQEGFEVLDEQGKRVLPTIPVTHGYGDSQAKLEDDQCIARLAELNLPALLERAWVLPGGEAFTAKSKREDVVGFIQKTRAAQDRARRGKPDLTDDDMSPEETAALAKMAA